MFAFSTDVFELPCPYYFFCSLDSIKASGVVSICAGVKLSQLEELNCPVIRIMPNLGVRVGAGTLPYCTSANCTEDLEKSVMSIFEPLGLAVKVQEKFFNAAQGISGCGPAFIALFIESMVDAGVREGLTRDVAWRLACQTGISLTLYSPRVHVRYF